MSTKDKPTPTAEQRDCVEKFLTGKPLVVCAYAGCGKTTGGVMMAEATRRGGTYLAFSKSIATDAQGKFPRSVACSTVHSLAYRALVGRFGRDKMSGSVNGGFLAEKLALRSHRMASGLELTPRGMGFLVSETLKRFQRSDRDEIISSDMPLEGKLADLDPRDLNPLREFVIATTRKLWEQMVDPRSTMPLGHDGYLKLWALSKPTVPGDFIFLDEAQDTNPVVLGIVAAQKAQVIAVGDQHQQIYEWRGAVDAMGLLPRELEARLSTSWRFGTAVAGYASKILELLGETVPLKGNPGKPSKLTEIASPDAILTRTNGRLLQELMDALDAGRKPCVIGGVEEMKRWLTATDRLMVAQSVEMPLEFFGFKNWQEVRETSEREDGAELRRWVKTVDDYGTDALRRALDSLPAREEQANLVLSTGHKSKGREWDKVRLTDDFLRGVRTEEEDRKKKALETTRPSESPDAELRLLYVAATRGIMELDVPGPLADKLAHLCNKSQIAPPPAFAMLARGPGVQSVQSVQTAQNVQPAALTPTLTPHHAEGVSSTRRGGETPPWEDLPDSANGNGHSAPKLKRQRINKNERETLVELLRREAGACLPGTPQHDHMAGLLSKMEAML